jgi:hypothetical protein
VYSINDASNFPKLNVFHSFSWEFYFIFLKKIFQSSDERNSSFSRYAMFILNILSSISVMFLFKWVITRLEFYWCWMDIKDIYDDLTDLATLLKFAFVGCNFSKYHEFFHIQHSINNFRCNK